MDKLEQYLDHVCRSIGGPKALRQHVRQELREHLLDAVAEHKAAGMAEEKALERALDDFGGPEQVRSELEATHGHRLLPVVIDKAMQWKEKTMRAKWLWTTWAHLVLAVAVVLEVISIAGAKAYWIPRTQKILREEWLDIDIANPAISWIPHFLERLSWLVDHPLWIVLSVALLWALFEWRLRGDNKSLMRLSALGTAALGLLVVFVVTAWALTVPFLLGVPGMDARTPERSVRDKETRVEISVSALEEALTRNDWDAIQENADQAAQAMDNLAHMGTAASAMVSLHEQPKVDELRAHLKASKDCLQEVRLAGWTKDAAKLEAALKKFHEAYGPVQAAGKPVKP